MTYEDVFKIVFAAFTSIGGASVVIIGISSWLGKVWANKILEKDKNTYTLTLEEIKVKYQKELEVHRNELDKAKTLFARYSEHQFNLYNELYSSLYDLKISADNLWELAEFNRLKLFSKQLMQTKKIIEKNILLIEDGHYEQLINLLDQFAKFKFGKTELIKTLDMHEHDIPFDHDAIQRVTENNQTIKENYNELIKEIGRKFKTQIKLGESYE